MGAQSSGDLGSLGSCVPCDRRAGQAERERVCALDPGEGPPQVRLSNSASSHGPRPKWPGLGIRLDSIIEAGYHGIGRLSTVCSRREGSASRPGAPPRASDARATARTLRLRHIGPEGQGFRLWLPYRFPFGRLKVPYGLAPR